MTASSTVECLLHQIGRGKNSISNAVEVARCAVKDGATSEAVVCMASLGSGGKHDHNLERDLHNWLKCAYNLELEPYFIKLDLLVLSLTQFLKQKHFSKECVRDVWGTTFCFEVGDELSLKETWIPILLPHEFLHAIVQAGRVQLEASLIGNLDDEDLSQFWKHVKSCEDWKMHPVFSGRVDFARLLPLILHIDGAEFYKNSEYYCWSFACPFAQGTLVDQKLLCMVLPHSAMMDEPIRNEVTRQDSYY